MARSLSRGLQVLALLSQRESCAVADFSRVLSIPRATVYRILITLMRDGFVVQHKSDQRFRLTPKVRTLSDGMSDELYIASLSRPFLEWVTRQLRWPVSFGALSGVELMVRENTDDESPLAADRFDIGYKMPLLTTATGLCILAHLNTSEFKKLRNTLGGIDSDWRMSTRDEAALLRNLHQVRNKGFATYHRRGKRNEMLSVAVPILDSAGSVKGAITIRFARKAVSLGHAAANFVPVMQEAARRIGARIESKDS